MSKVNKKNANGGKKKSPARTKWVRKDRKKGMSDREKEIETVLNSGKPSKKLMRAAAKQLIFDPRSSLGGKVDLYIENSNPQIPFSVPLDAESLIGPILAVSGYAIGRGWPENVDSSFLFHSFVYHIKALELAATNVSPQFTSCPRWLNYLMQSLNRKTIKTQGGWVNYVFDLQTAYTPDYKQAVGPPVFGRMWNIGVKTATLVNGIFNTIGAPAPYTESLGQQAAQSLWQFLANINENSDMHQLVEVNKKERMTLDGSAFACLLPSPGGGIGQTGAWGQLVYQEIPVKSPIFSVFVTNPNNSFDAARWQRFSRQFAGDGSQLGGFLVSKLSSHQVSMKTPPKIHFVDFHMFATELAYFVCLVQENALIDEDTIEAMANDPNYFVDNIQCKLTLQEMQLLLRGVMMEAFQSSQYCYQTLFPRTATQGDNEFVSFCAGFGTASVPGTTDMQLPLLLKENILSLTERVVIAGRGGDSNPSFYIPSLGIYANDVMSTKDFTVTMPDGESEETCFLVVPGEVPVNLVDGQAGADYLCINDPKALIVLAQKWNEWQQQNSNFMHTMASLGSDTGMDPLYSGCMTEHWIQQPLGQRKIRSTSKGKKQQTPMEKRFEKIEVEETDSLYANRNLLAVSTAAKPYKNAWEGVQQYFIKAVNKVNPSTRTGQFTAYTRIAADMGEMIQIPLGYGDVGFISYSQKLRNAAQLMVKQKFTDEQGLTMLLTEAEKKGEGGILSSLAATLAGQIVPGSGPILQGIADILPF